MPNTMTRLRQQRDRSSLRAAYLPALDSERYDVPNAYGSRLGRIGDMPALPMAPTGSYAAGEGLRRMSGERGGIGYSPQYGYQVTGHTAYDGGFQGVNPAEAWAMRNPSPYSKAAPPRVEVKNRNLRSGSNTDSERIAINRLRGGMSLNPDEELLLSALEKKTPGILGALRSGSFADRQDQARETVRQRGLARGDARAMRRNYQDNVRGGMTPGLAGAMAMSGGGPVDPMMAALAGALPANAAVGFAQTTNRLRAQEMENASGDARSKQATLLAALQSENPAIQTWAAGQLGMPTGKNGLSLTQQPNADGTPNLGLTNDDMLALDNRQGDETAIAEYGRQQGWSADKIAAVQREYGKTVPQKTWDLWKQGWNLGTGMLTPEPTPQMQSAVKGLRRKMEAGGKLLRGWGALRSLQ